MLVRSDCALEIHTSESSFSPLMQMVDRRLTIAQMGLAEASRYLAAGQADAADIVLDKIDEDLHLLRSRLIREAETLTHHPASLHGCPN